MAHGRHRADRRMGPASRVSPGPSARPRQHSYRLLILAPLLVLGSGVGVLAAEVSSTQAMFSSMADKQVSSLQAGHWDVIPAECGDLRDYSGGVVYGTEGDDVINAGNHPQIILGLNGDDTIKGDNSGDCLVGGNGDDKLYGQDARDVLIGGPGKDYLSGGNGPDLLDAGGDAGDVCDAGRGPATLIGCSTPHHASLSTDTSQEQAGPVDTASPQDAPASPSASPSETTMADKSGSSAGGDPAPSSAEPTPAASESDASVPVSPTTTSTPGAEPTS